MGILTCHCLHSYLTLKVPKFQIQHFPNVFQSRSSELFGIQLCLPVSLATKFLHLRSTKYKSRTRDPVPTLIIRTRTSVVSVENILQINFFSDYNRFFRYQRNIR